LDTEYNGGTLGVANPGSGEPWEWRTLGVVNPGSRGLWEWRTLGVANPGSGEPWEWCILGMADPFRGPTNFNFFVTGKLSTVPYRISHAESSGVVGFLLSRQVFEKIYIYSMTKPF